MANPVYTISAIGATFQLNKCLIGLYNGAGSGLVLRIHRIWGLNNQTVAVTGIQQILSICRLSTGSGGYSILPVKHDSLSASLPSAITYGTNIDYTIDTTIRRIAWSSDEPVGTDAAGIDEIQCIPAFTMFWDYSQAYDANCNVEPLVLRPGYGVGVIVSSAVLTAFVGAMDVFIEFSSGAS